MTRSVWFLFCALAAAQAVAQSEAPLAPGAPASRATAASIAGRALTEKGEPAAGAAVRLAGTSRRATADADGRFAFADLPPGRYVVEAVSPRFGSDVAVVELPAGGRLEVELRLDVAVHREEVVVTATPDARSGEELVRPASTLAGEELLAAAQPTLGETLSSQPGVHSTYFGPGSSRPIIRGLGGDRIRVLESGLGVGDASTTGPDHAVAFDPLGAERIEIVRGPATLLYGSSAVGGVVNLLDGSIPDYLPEEPLTGEATLRYGSNADERAGAVKLGGAVGRFAWRLGASKRETDDYEIPGHAEAETPGEPEEEEHEEMPGVLANSALETDSMAAGLSWVGDDGFLGLSWSGFDTLYGVPGHAHHNEHEGEEEEEEEEEEEPPVRVDLEQRRLDLRGEWTGDLGILRGLKLRAGRSDYEHRELEGAQVGTRFLADGWEGRVEALHRPLGRMTGAWGLQAGRRDFEAIGEEAFVPASTSDSWALFAFEELAAGAVTWQFGGRYERQAVDVATALPDRDFSGLSGSLGLTWRATEAISTRLSLSRSVTAPNPEALYSDGPHVATRTFERGDPTLDEEISLGLDAGLHFEAGPLHVEGSVYLNRVDDFVFEAFTGEQEDGLPVVEFRQSDAELTGGELEAHVELVHSEPHHLELDLSADWVRAELRASGERLPRIPPLRFGAGLGYRGERWSAGVDATRYEAQERIAPLETPTDGYTLVGARVGLRLFAGATVHDLLLTGTNLTDEEARPHTSFLKDQAPLPGRDLRLTYRVAF